MTNGAGNIYTMINKYLAISLGLDGNFVLRFRIRQTPLAQLWVQRMLERTAWPLDHPDRFYGFDSAKHERNRASTWIQHCIDVVNSHRPVIDRRFEFTQDCLNYLHSKFEQHHGLLDQQHSDFWQTASDPVRRALAELNLAVHRCENVLHGTSAKFVCTWFGMPKTHSLPAHVRQCYGDSRVTWGTVYLNYVEIGKTVEDLVRDNDSYISQEAFQPFERYSADFNVAFHDRNLHEQYGKIQHYIDQHADFFVARGITSVYNVQARPVRYPVADLILEHSRQHIMCQIAQRQWIKQVVLE